LVKGWRKTQESSGSPTTLRPFRWRPTTKKTNKDAVKEATSAIPIVFAAAGDPVGSGLVASLARPGGNLTGSWTDLAGKRLELLREALPSLRPSGLMLRLRNDRAYA
jgi:ABC-type uncharacterized transport system substrate-binding protein